MRRRRSTLLTIHRSSPMLTPTKRYAVMLQGHCTVRSRGFAEQALLEAVLITASAMQTEKLLEIATRWDILHLA